MKLETLKQISIKAYLASKGICPVNRSLQRGMFPSPFREELHPSFTVDYVKNLWYDHGLGHGGSIIDLVMRMENCSVGEAILKLKEADLPVMFLEEARTAENALKIVKAGEIVHSSLVGYALSRCIRQDVLLKYCKEIDYTMYGHARYALGFVNDSGGWELRTEKCKMSSAPKDITTIAGDDRSTALVFEGFFDFLTYASMLGDGGILPGDVVVLNSLAMLHRGRKLDGYRKLRLYFDNDEAGKGAVRETKNQYPKAEVKDCSDIYEGFKDLNEYHISKTMDRLMKENPKMNDQFPSH